MSESKSWRVKRDGLVDLVFRGRLVGEGEHGTGGNSGFSGDWSRGTTVKLYLSDGGKVVVAVCHWSKWQGEEDSFLAAVLDTGAEALAWLLDEGQGELGRAAKEALETAALEPELAGIDVEEVA